MNQSPSHGRDSRNANPKIWGPKTWVPKIALGLVLACLFVAVWASGVSQYLSFDALRQHRAILLDLVTAHPVLAIIAYLAIYTASTALSLPGGLVLTLTGGFLFGAALGTGLTVVAATVGATLVFLFARVFIGADGLSRFGPKAAALVSNIQRNAWSYLLVLRLVPVFPFFLVNLVPAFAGVKLRTFILTTAFGIIPGTAIFALSGAGLGRVLDTGGELSARQILTPEIIAGLTGLAALSLVAIPVKAWLARRDADNASDSQSGSA
jgi:uncharacterized membrane protein YdjX (TVP38/TMEM64 family)